MTTPKTITKPETICTRFSRINLDPTSVCNFIEWLCGMEPIIDFEQTQADRDPVETTLGWNAPRQRMAKLLWQLIYGDSNEEFFDQHFFYHDAVRGKETQTILV
jgi:hypothetical protein